MRWLGMVLGVVAGTAQAADLELTIAVRNGDGQVLVAVFDSADTFAKEGKEVVGVSAAIAGGTARTVIAGLKPGRYAVAGFHDENGNGKLDTNLLGIPTEGYGFSRDARGTLGPPSFGAAAFDLPDTGAKQTFTMGY
jgi:uncharacterized protein (DUF2141 family)